MIGTRYSSGLVPLPRWTSLSDAPATRAIREMLPFQCHFGRFSFIERIAERGSDSDGSFQARISLTSPKNAKFGAKSSREFKKIDSANTMKFQRMNVQTRTNAVHQKSSNEHILETFHWRIFVVSERTLLLFCLFLSSLSSFAFFPFFARISVFYAVNK